MQETVTNTKEDKKSRLTLFLDILDAREKKAAMDRQLQEEKFLRRTQRIYEFHERQCRSAGELRRCLEYVSQHAHVLETALRAAGEGGEGAPLGAALVRQAAALQRQMAACVDNAARIRQALTAAHRDQMDAMLTKMEGELRGWTTFLQRAVDATGHSETIIDNLHNMIAEQRRCVREVSASSVLAALCGDGGAGADSGDRGEQRPPSACSTPLPRD